MFLQISFVLENFPTQFALKYFPLKVAIFLHHVCFLYVNFQIAFGLKSFTTKDALFSSCDFCMCFLELPLVQNIFPQQLYFFLPTKIANFSSCVFLCDSSNCLRSEKFSLKSCTFSSCVFVCVFSNCLRPGNFSHRVCT